ncbi:MAG: DNA-binding protein [Clostridia bacterium]|nr:DNA-binding protein [Clostridia bacterium]
MNISQIIKLGKMLDLYGALLTEKQFKILNSYVNYNGSLSEIAEEYNISRQAVADLVKRTTERLQDLESKLKFCNKIEVVIAKVPEILSKQNLTEQQKISCEKSIIELIKTLED